MIQSASARAQRVIAAASAGLAVTAALLIPANPALAGKPTTQKLLQVGDTIAAECSVSFDVTNPNSNGQKIEIGAMNTTTEDKVYSTTRIGGGETNKVSVSVPGGAKYVGSATNSAGRTYSTVESATVTC